MLVAVSAALLSACGSSTAPNPKLRITLTGPATYVGRDTTFGSMAFYSCVTRVTATASGGKPGQVATWATGHYTLTLASTGQRDSSSLQAASQYFGGSPILATGTQVSGTSLTYWSGPFSLSETFYYSTPQEQIDSATYSFACQ
jgi:hypothetical protein